MHLPKSGWRNISQLRAEGKCTFAIYRQRFSGTCLEDIAKYPLGSLITYGNIACEIAAQRGLARMSAQAVGGAVGRNPLCIIIPCHRVIGADGSLTGYGGGMWRKVRLLELEKIDMSKLTVPTKGTAL